MYKIVYEILDKLNLYGYKNSSFNSKLIELISFFASRGLTIKYLLEERHNINTVEKCIQSNYEPSKHVLYIIIEEIGYKYLCLPNESEIIKVN